MRFDRLLAMAAAAVFLAACGRGGAEQAAAVDESLQQTTEQQAPLSETLCDLLPQADAESIMGKALVTQRNDAWGCHYQDAVGTAGTGLMLDLNVLTVSDQCRLTPESEPLSGVGSEACIAVGVPAGLYTTVVFGIGGRTFVATAPGQDRASELATAVATVITTKLGS
jgi:hypothetical protein